MREVLEACSAIGPISQQQALRLVLGMGYNKESAVSKWRDVVAWRQAEEMHVLRSRLDDLMCGEASVTFADDSDVYSKLFRGCPCALLTMDERPVSVWNAGATNADKVTSLPTEDLKAWSREVFEYADLWVTKQTERTRRLTGYIQVYNMQGLSLRHTSKEVTERLKAALSAGGSMSKQLRTFMSSMHRACSPWHGSWFEVSCRPGQRPRSRSQVKFPTN